MKENPKGLAASHNPRLFQAMVGLLALCLIWLIKQAVNAPTQPTNKIEECHFDQPLYSQRKSIQDVDSNHDAINKRVDNQDSHPLLHNLVCPDGPCSSVRLANYGIQTPLGAPFHYHLFLHIPKTGGASVREFFRGICTYHNITTGVTLNASRKSAVPFFRTKQRTKIKAVFGHYGYGMHRILSPQSTYTYYASFRDPVERWMSHFVWAKKRRYAYMKPHNLTTWVDVGYDCNLQFAVLSGLVPNDFSLQNKIHGSWPIPCDHYDQHHLDLVQRIIKVMDSEFQLIVLQSHFKQSLVLLCEHFRIPDDVCVKIMEKNDDQIHITNSSSRLQELSRRQLRIVKMQNHLDNIIYEHLQSQFDKKWRAYKMRHPESSFSKL